VDVQRPATDGIVATGREHELKTWPGPFRRMWDGSKTFEVRWNDRDYQEGDELLLREYSLGTDTYSGRWIKGLVTCIVGDNWGLPPGLVVMAIREVSRGEESLAVSE
jgi:hypothetical protein